MIGSLSGLTPNWLETALNLEPGTVDSIEIGPVGTGQVAASYRLKVNGDAYRGPPSFIVKVPSENPDSLRAGLHYNLYAHEVAWYQQYAAETNARCPLSLYSEFSEDGNRFILLLEDCSPAAQGDQLKGASLDDIGNALNEAANLHGAFGNRPDLLARLRPTSSARSIGDRADFFRTSWNIFRQRYENELFPEILDLGDRLSTKYEALISRPVDERFVIHKDMRIDNMLFGGPDGRVILLDWQTYGLGHPMTDVANLIGTSFVDASIRSANERGLVKRYCTALSAMRPDIDQETFWAEYRIQAFAGFAMAVTSSVLVARTQRGDEMFAAMATRTARQALDLDSLSMIP